MSQFDLGSYEKCQNLRKAIGNREYSLASFDQYKCLYVHVPKCAGVSVTKGLFGNLAGGHTPLRQYQGIFDQGEYEEYFKFSFVRNPWDRLVSAYSFLKSGGMNSSDSAWAEANISMYENFRDFVLNWLSRENIWSQHHFRPQYHYLLDAQGNLGLDFIGRVESLEQDFETVASRLGIDATLPHINSSCRDNYKSYYDQEMADKVLSVYYEDISLLGYENPSELNPIVIPKPKSIEEKKVFGIGLNKTGTTSLGVCFQQLGFRHTSMHLGAYQALFNGELEAVFSTADKYQAFEDWPWPLLYRDMADRYPEAQFILTRRSSAEVWYESLCKHAERTGPTPYRERIYGHAMPHEFKQEHIDFYNRHLDEVSEFFSNKPGRLLEVCWEEGHGWVELSDFLGVVVPSLDFPHANKRPG